MKLGYPPRGAPLSSRSGAIEPFFTLDSDRHLPVRRVLSILGRAIVPHLPFFVPPNLADGAHARSSSQFEKDWFFICAKFIRRFIRLVTSTRRIVATGWFPASRRRLT